MMRSVDVDACNHVRKAILSQSNIGRVYMLTKYRAYALSYCILDLEHETPWQPARIGTILLKQMPPTKALAEGVTGRQPCFKINHFSHPQTPT